MWEKFAPRRPKGEGDFEFDHLEMGTAKVHRPNDSVVGERVKN